MSTVEELLTSPERSWTPNAPASEDQVSELIAAMPFAPPAHYIELIRACNGGEGELALKPLCFQLFDTTFAISLLQDQFYCDNFPGLFFFGSNGGLESIAIEVETGRIVMLDCIAGPESAIEIAPNMTEFIKAIGVPAPTGT